MKCFYWLLVALSFSLGLKLSEAERIPIENFFRAPAASQFSISPDGEYVAFLYPLDDIISAVTVSIENKEDRVNGLRGGWRDDVNSLYWANNDQIIFNVTKSNQYAGGLYVCQRGSKKARILNAYDALYVVDPAPERPDTVLAWIYDSTEGGSRLVDYDPQSGVSAIVFKEPRKQNTLEWFTDLKGRPFARYYYHENEAHFAYGPESFSSETNILDHSKIRGLGYVRFLDYDRASRSYWISGYRRNRSTKSLHKLDLNSFALSEAYLEDDDFDVLDDIELVNDPYKGRVVGAHFDRVRPESVWFDDAYKQAQRIVNVTFKDTTNRIVDADRKCNRFVVFSFSDVNPGVYSVVDIKERAVVFSMNVNSGLAPSDMRKQRPFKLKMENGMKLEGYLTLPGPKSAGPYPMVTLAHGGPWARDTWGFDPEVQLLANRGYAVLQLNFRGSTGYPLEISENHSADFKGMVDDLSEATRKVVEMGFADPERLAIMGSSFGGYAAVASAAFDPELYQCAVSFAGVFDVELQMKNWKSRFWRKRQGTSAYDTWVSVLGDPETADAYIESISPIHHVDQIKIPIMLIHGKSDEVVSAKQSKNLARAMARAGNKPITHYISRERHSLMELKSRIKGYAAVEKFLAKHLGD